MADLAMAKAGASLAPSAATGRFGHATSSPVPASLLLRLGARIANSGRTTLVGSPGRRRIAVSNIKESLAKIMQLDGAMGTCVVDSNSGMMLGSDGGAGPINLEVAAAGNTEVVRAKRKTMKALNLKDTIEDILITLHGQYHLIRPLSSNDALFIYLVLDKQRGNLAMSRHQLANIEKELAI
jgi:hypothetical protein